MQKKEKSFRHIHKHNRPIDCCRLVALLCAAHHRRHRVYMWWRPYETLRHVMESPSTARTTTRPRRHAERSSNTQTQPRREKQHKHVCITPPLNSYIPGSGGTWGPSFNDPANHSTGRTARETSPRSAIHDDRSIRPGRAETGGGDERANEPPVQQPADPGDDRPDTTQAARARGGYRGKEERRERSGGSCALKHIRT